MTGSALAHTLDQLQASLDPKLRQFGFRKHGRIYNRSTADGLTHVIGFQMGRSDPPGTIYIPGLRENLYGLFAVNLGVYVPEVARDHGGREAKSVVHEYNCCIRTRLKRKANKDLWWTISDGGPLVAEISELIQAEACRYSSASKIEIKFSMSFKRRPTAPSSWRCRESFAPSSSCIAGNGKKRGDFWQRRRATTRAIPAIALTLLNWRIGSELKSGRSTSRLAWPARL